MRYFLVLTFILLTSCGFTAEEIAAAQKAGAEKRRLADEAACTGYGFRKGTDAFSNCMQQEAHNRKQLGAAERAAQAAYAARRSAQRASETAQLDAMRARNCRLYGGGWCF